MDIKIKYNRQQRVAFRYRNAYEILEGEVDEINIEVNENGCEISYTILADKVIKGSRKHYHSEESVYPNAEAIKQKFPEYRD